MGEVWRTFAWDEIQSRYRRSALGLVWIAISYLLFVIAVSVFFGAYSTRGFGPFLHYVAIGYATLMLMLASLSEGCWVFRGSASWIQSTSMPYSVYIYKGIARSLFPFVVQLGVALPLMLATDWRPSLVSLLAIPALLLILLTAVGVQLFLGFLSSYSRDVGHLVQSLQRMLFFLTPIVWVLEEREGPVGTLALFNPFTHYLQLLRKPLLGELPDLVTLCAVGVLTPLTLLAGLVISSKMRHRLPFWV